MIRKRIVSTHSALAVAALVLFAAVAPVQAQIAMGTAFTYQGRLTDGGEPIENAVDVQYSLWDAASGGIPLGTPVLVPNTAYSAGLLQAELDFGDQFSGDPRYLQIELANPAGGGLEALSPRVEMKPVPYALHAETVTNIDDADADANNETITSTALAGNTLRITEAGVDHDTDLSPLVPTLGSIAVQDSTSVAILGGTIDNTVIGGSTPAAGTFTSVSATTVTATTGTFGTTSTVIGDTIQMSAVPLPDPTSNTLYNMGGNLYWQNIPLSATTQPIIGTNVLGDLTVDGSLGVGMDTVPGMTFDFDTIILKENNLRIFFDDTSTSGSFPRNDWRITANDSANGGESYLGFEDATRGTMPFRIKAGASSYRLVINDDGNVGVGTANPAGLFQVGIPGTASVDQSQATETAAITIVNYQSSPLLIIDKLPAWQSFTAGKTGELTEFQIKPGGVPVGFTGSWAIYEGEGVAGQVLAAGSFSSVPLPNQLFAVSVPMPFPITAGSQYTLAIVYASYGLDDPFELWMADTNPYVAGVANESASHDWVFTTSVRDVAAPLTVSATGNVGIGSASAENPLHVVGSLNGDGVSSHVALIDNVTTGTRADGLAIRIGRTDNPGTDNNFITFYNGNNASFGAIQGNGASVQYAAAGADLAEYLPLADPEESLEAGDVVGVVGGYISKQTEGAERVFVVSTAPAFAGNDPGQGNRGQWKKVAFIGQVPVQVRGEVQPGDLLLASGRGDGVATAVAAEALRPEQSHLIVGRAWEASEEEGIKLINAEVGLSNSVSMTAALYAEIRQQQETIESLQSQNVSLEKRLSRIEAMIPASSRRVQSRRVDGDTLANEPR